MTIHPSAHVPAINDPRCSNPGNSLSTTAPEPSIVMTLAKPPWADSSALDAECVMHRLALGKIVPADGDVPFTVEVFSRDDFVIDAGEPSVTRSEPRIAVSGEALTVQEARDLARLLSDALAIVEQTEREVVGGE